MRRSEKMLLTKATKEIRVGDKVFRPSFIWQDYGVDRKLVTAEEKARAYKSFLKLGVPTFSPDGSLWKASPDY